MKFILAIISHYSATSNLDTDIETRVDIIVKNPEVIILEDQQNSNSNCLVLDVSYSMNKNKRVSLPIVICS